MAEQREWKNGKPGKLAGQKLKSLLVIQYILKHADEDHPVTMENIQQHLAPYGIEAERRSIYRDIDAINEAVLIAHGEARNIKEAKELVTQIEGKLSIIARQGRAFGIHLILATQRPDANILAGQITILNV